MGERSSQRVVANGREAHVATAEYEAAVAQVRERVTREFAPLIANAGLVERQVLRLKRHRRLRREIESLAPRGALYATRNRP